MYEGQEGREDGYERKTGNIATERRKGRKEGWKDKEEEEGKIRGENKKELHDDNKNMGRRGRGRL